MEGRVLQLSPKSQNCRTIRCVSCGSLSLKNADNKSQQNPFHKTDVFQNITFEWFSLSFNIGLDAVI